MFRHEARATETLGNIRAKPRHDHDPKCQAGIAGASGMARRKNTTRRPRGVGQFRGAQRKILLPFLVIWLAALSLFDRRIDPNFP